MPELRNPTYYMGSVPRKKRGTTWRFQASPKNKKSTQECRQPWISYCQRVRFPGKMFPAEASCIPADGIVLVQSSLQLSLEYSTQDFTHPSVRGKAVRACSDRYAEEYDSTS